MNSNILSVFWPILLLSWLTQVHTQETPSSDQDSDLLLSVVITRHGDRTPTKGYQNMKSEWPTGYGQLSVLGMHQHYQLGQKFRERYVYEHELVSEYYHKDEVYVRSTGKERTLQSAYSFMLGFFPPGESHFQYCPPSEDFETGEEDEEVKAATKDKKKEKRKEKGSDKEGYTEKFNSDDNLEKSKGDDSEKPKGDDSEKSKGDDSEKSKGDDSEKSKEGDSRKEKKSKEKKDKKEKTEKNRHKKNKQHKNKNGCISMPFGIQPVPIHSAEKRKDTLLYAYKNCKAIKEMKKEFKRSEEFTQMTAQHSSLLSELSNIFGLDDVGLTDVTGFLNLLKGEKIHSKNRTFEDPSVISQMEQIADWVFRHKFHNQTVGKLGIGYLMEDITKRMEAIQILHNSNQPLDHRFVLYSAHDGTLLALMAAMEWNNLHIPRYASHLVFEFWGPQQNEKNSQGSENEVRNENQVQNASYWVRVLYDDQPIDIGGGCGTSCSLEKFSAVSQKAIPQDWENECRNDPERWVKQHFIGNDPITFD